VRPYDYKDAASLLCGFLDGSKGRPEGKRCIAMKTLKVGIASAEDMIARTMLIARGELKPTAADAKVWFHLA
jgi:predicted transcriptional regulator